MDVLLVGNGLNQMARTLPDWNTLFSEAVKIKGFSVGACLTPTLGFELNAINAAKIDPSKTENQILRDIASYIAAKEMSAPVDWDSSIHQRLLKCAPQTILTTNYDYFLERTIQSDYHPGRVETTERRYSFRRLREVGDYTIYHIHGEASAPFSICLGYERYSGSIQYLRTALTKQSDHHFHLYNVLCGHEAPQESCWYYSFFTDDVYILGLGLDAAELDLWWLMNYRAELMRKYPDLIKNKLVYLETDSADDAEPNDAAITRIAEALKKVTTTQAQRKLLAVYGEAFSRAVAKRNTVTQKRELLEAFQVTVKDCTDPNDVPAATTDSGTDWAKVYENRYQRALDFLQMR